MGKSSKRWVREHRADEFVKLSRAGGFRSRAVFKLKEIDERDGLFRGVSTAVDLGAAPGGWSQFARTRLPDSARLVAMDVLPMDPIEGVQFIQGDFRDTEVLEELLANIGNGTIDLVMSDMAPNISGMTTVDQARSIHLCELALDLAQKVLTPGGTLLVKAFHGEGYEAFSRDLKESFAKVRVRKPRASRDRSREVYILARELRA
jgi:23S rRNA (uridine2552-2'-O)-methyltransferase